MSDSSIQTNRIEDNSNLRLFFCNCDNNLQKNHNSSNYVAIVISILFLFHPIYINVYVIKILQERSKLRKRESFYILIKLRCVFSTTHRSFVTFPSLYKRRYFIKHSFSKASSMFSLNVFLYNPVYRAHKTEKR